MIVQRYSDFRGLFALDGASAAADGLEEWPVANLRSGGFTGLVTPTITSFPLTITCNGGAIDGGAAFDWYLSQRTDDPARQYLTITHTRPTKSGTVTIDINEDRVAALLPDVSGPALFEAGNLGLLMKNVALYVQRRSDKAYQWIKLYA